MYEDHKGRIIFVHYDGKGNYFPMVRTLGGGYLRYGTPALPTRTNQEQAENDLAGYAKHMRWRQI